MRNKPNLPNAQMNVSSLLTKDYENERLRRHRKNKPNQTQFEAQSNPIKANSKPKQSHLIHPSTHSLIYSSTVFCPPSSVRHTTYYIALPQVRHTNHGPRVTGHGSRATSHRARVTCHESRGTRCAMHITKCYLLISKSFSAILKAAS